DQGATRSSKPPPEGCYSEWPHLPPASGPHCALLARVSAPPAPSAILALALHHPIQTSVAPRAGSLVSRRAGPPEFQSPAISPARLLCVPGIPRTRAA